MGIKLANGVAVPAITYDMIHLTNLTITQQVFTDDAQAPVYMVDVYYKHYGVVDGVRYYNPNEDVQHINIRDFIVVAQADAAQGDTTLLQALSSIEQAVAAIIADQTGASVSLV